MTITDLFFTTMASFKKLALLAFIVQNVWQVAYSITCLSCGGDVDNLSSCRDIVECNSGHTCYIERALSLTTNTQKYRAGCRDIHDCNLLACSQNASGSVLPTHQTPRPGISKRQNRDQVICTECCYNDTCNTKGCGADFSAGRSSGSNQLQCFQCTRQREDSVPCTTFSSCQSGESCYYDYRVQADGPPFYELGCKSIAFCNFYLAHVKEEDRTTHCCDDHLCNQSPYKTANTSQTIFEALQCATDLVPTNTSTTPTPATTTTYQPPTTNVGHVSCLGCVNSSTHLAGCRIVQCNAETEWCFVTVDNGLVNAGCKSKQLCQTPVPVGRRQKETKDQSRDVSACSTCCDPAKKCLCNGIYCGLDNYAMLYFLGKANCPGV